MKYRKFGKTGMDVSVLGFGAMRLPQSNETIDESAAADMVQYAIQSGINYFDTAYLYHQGESESFLGRTLMCSGVDRDKIILATKLPVWDVEKRSDFDTILNTQLDKLQTDYIDTYMFHSLKKRFWQKILDLDLIEKMEQAKEQGKIRHIGFSFHADYTTFKEIIDTYGRWDFCQVQYNYLDIENQAGMKGVKYAEEKGIPVIAMEPLLGGKLVTPPKKILDEFAKVNTEMSAVEWALKWIWNQSAIPVVLSGMSSMEQLKQNIEYANMAEVGYMSDSEQEAVYKAYELLPSILKVKCTHCKYCLPCPSKVAIPSIFKLYNDIFAFEAEQHSKEAYDRWIAGHGQGADNCTGCKACESKCPQDLEISKLLPEIHAYLAS